MPTVSDKDRKMTETTGEPGGNGKKSYKGDQGRLARLAVFWSLGILLCYGCVSLYRTLSPAFGGKLATPFLPSLKSIPVLGLPMNPATLITGVVLAGAWYALYRWQQTPKVADLLIETEAELRKVTWPTIPEAVNSSIVVIVCVILLMGFLAGADWLLGQWTTMILTGGNG
jgi:preprotein translocase SecE subunit